jgi:outer membrane murein-binding lipoprotein Lpp
MADITTAELIECRNNLLQAIEVLRTVRQEALGANRIDQTKFEKLQTKELLLESKASALSIAIIVSQLDTLATDVSSPKAEIIAATDKLDAANTRLQDFDKFLDLLAKVVNLFGVIVNAVQQPALATISTIINHIKPL